MNKHIHGIPNKHIQATNDIFLNLSKTRKNCHYPVNKTNIISIDIEKRMEICECSKNWKPSSISGPTNNQRNA